MIKKRAKDKEKQILSQKYIHKVSEGSDRVRQRNKQKLKRDSERV